MLYLKISREQIKGPQTLSGDIVVKVLVWVVFWAAALF